MPSRQQKVFEECDELVSAKNYSLLRKVIRGEADEMADVALPRRDCARPLMYTNSAAPLLLAPIVRNCRK